MTLDKCRRRGVYGDNRGELMPTQAETRGRRAHQGQVVRGAAPDAKPCLVKPLQLSPTGRPAEPSSAHTPPRQAPFLLKSLAIAPRFGSLSSPTPAACAARSPAAKRGRRAACRSRSQFAYPITMRICLIFENWGRGSDGNQAGSAQGLRGSPKAPRLRQGHGVGSLHRRARAPRCCGCIKGAIR